MPRKRDRTEMEEDHSFAESPQLDRIRNMWEFANLNQYIFTFGKVVKIDEDLDIDELEAECLKPTHSEKLSAIGLALLKFVSSHKGLTPELFDEYTRRQFVAKAPHRNPFGEDEEPRKFSEFDTFTKIRVLQQLSVWTLGNADRIRERMPEKDAEQTQWRIEPFGWDQDDRIYFLLDDDRLYRRTDPPLPEPPKARAKSKSSKSKSTRASKRRRISTTESHDENEDGDQDDTVLQEEDQHKPDEDTFGGMKWECLAVTLEDYQGFLESIRRSRDPNEKALFKRIQSDVMPIIEKKKEEQEKKIARRMRELENLQKLATAKRSSRIAGRMEKQKEQEAAEEAERKHRDELYMARKEVEKQRKMEEARESRMMTREQRLKEREVKRILHEEELKRLEEESKRASSEDVTSSRMSARHLKSEMEKRKRELEVLNQEQEWIFDCSVCGMYGQNLDDGTHSIACDRCNIWQHSACHGIKPKDADKEGFEFVCADCKRKEEDSKRPRIKIRFSGSGSPKTQRTKQEQNGVDVQGQDLATQTAPAVVAGTLSHVAISPPSLKPYTPQPPTSGTPSVMNGPSLSPQGQSAGPPGSSMHYPSTDGPTPVSFTLPAGRSPFINGTPAISFSSTVPDSVNGSFYRAPTNGTVNGVSSGERPSSAHANGYTPFHRSNVTIPPPDWHNGPHDPFVNSFEQQRPGSSHSRGRQGSPLKNFQISSPVESRSLIGNPSFAPSASPATSFPPSTQKTAAYSPVKQASSPIQRPYSPSVLPPSSAGISPTKHDSPGPPSRRVADAHVLESAPNLTPSPKRQIMDPPVKRATPELPRLV